MFHSRNIYNFIAEKLWHEDQIYIIVWSLCSNRVVIFITIIPSHCYILYYYITINSSCCCLFFYIYTYFHFSTVAFLLNSGQPWKTFLTTCLTLNCICNRKHFKVLRPAILLYQMYCIDFESKYCDYCCISGAAWELLHCWLFFFFFMSLSCSMSVSQSCDLYRPLVPCEAQSSESRTVGKYSVSAFFVRGPVVGEVFSPVWMSSVWDYFPLCCWLTGCPLTQHGYTLTHKQSGGIRT